MAALSDDKLFRQDEICEDEVGYLGQQVVYWTLSPVMSFAAAVEHKVLHREQGPAVEWEDGGYEWHHFGVPHRPNGPAVWWPAEEYERGDGTEQWFQYGQLHRDGDLPAVTMADGTQQWFQHGLMHRDGDGPAQVDASGSQVWFRQGVPHRDYDLPAVVRSDGSQEWRQNGVLHRDGDDPAFIFGDGDFGWWQHGQKHRDGGRPACIEARSDGTAISWWDHGRRVLELMVFERGSGFSLDGKYGSEFDVAHELADRGLVLPDALDYCLPYELSLDRDELSEEDDEDCDPDQEDAPDWEDEAELVTVFYVDERGDGQSVVAVDGSLDISY